MKRNFETMKRRFASPLLISRDSSLCEADFSNLSKADPCWRQPEMRRFTSPLVVNRAPDLSVGSIYKAKQFSSSSQPDDQSMEIPKTPKSCPTAASATRTATRRLFHDSERYSQVNTLQSSAPLRLTPSRPLLVEPANKQKSRENIGVRKSRCDEFQMEAGSSSSILRNSVDVQSKTVDNLAMGGNAKPFRQSNVNDISGTKPSAGRDEEFSKPGHNPSGSEGRSNALNNEHAQSLGSRDYREIRQAGHLSNVLQDGSDDVLRSCITNPESPINLPSGNICSLEVFPYPLALQDIAALPCNRLSILEKIMEYALMAKKANPPARSAKESELMNDCMKKLKVLLVPTSVPFGNLVLPNQIPKSFLQIVFELNMVQPWSRSLRDSIKENARSCEAVQPQILADEKKVSECVTTSLVKTTRLMQEVPGGNRSHLRIPPQPQDKNSNHLQKIWHGVSYNNNHTVTISPHKSTKSDETGVCVLSPKGSLSPSSLYMAQSLEFRSIWSSKKLKMAEIAVACLTQNEILFSTLV